VRAYAIAHDIGRQFAWKDRGNTPGEPTADPWTEPPAVLRREAQWLACRMATALFRDPCPSLDVIVASAAARESVTRGESMAMWQRQLASVLDSWLCEVSLAREGARRRLLSDGAAAVDDILPRLRRELVDAPATVIDPASAVRGRLAAAFADPLEALRRERRKGSTAERKNAIHAGERLAAMWVVAVGERWPNQVRQTKTPRRVGSTTREPLAGPEALLDVLPLGPSCPAIPLSVETLGIADPTMETIALCVALERQADGREVSEGTAVDDATRSSIRRGIVPVIITAFYAEARRRSHLAAAELTTAAAMRACFGLEPWQVRWWSVFDHNFTELAQLLPNGRRFAERVRDLAAALSATPPTSRLLRSPAVTDASRAFEGVHLTDGSPGRTHVTTFGAAHRWAKCAGVPFPDRQPRRRGIPA